MSVPTTTAWLLLLCGIPLFGVSLWVFASTMGRAPGRFFISVFGLPLSLLMMIIGGVGLGNHYDTDDSQQQRTSVQRLLGQASNRQRQLYDQYGSFSDSERDAVSAQLSAALADQGWQLLLDESEIDGSVRLLIRDEDGQLLGQRVLPSPSPGDSS